MSLGFLLKKEEILRWPPEVDAAEAAGEVVALRLVAPAAAGLDLALLALLLLLRGEAGIEGTAAGAGGGGGGGGELGCG